MSSILTWYRWSGWN